VAEHLVRLADVFQDASRKLLCEILAPATRLQDCKLIAAEATDEIARSQTRRQPIGHALQIPIANLMAVLVVDLLEVIEIDPVQGEAEPWIVAFKLALEPLAELKAVRDTR
jgi:hypothetical protein